MCFQFTNDDSLNRLGFNDLKCVGDELYCQHWN